MENKLTDLDSVRAHIKAMREDAVKLTLEYVIEMDDHGCDVSAILYMIAGVLEEKTKVYATDPMNAGLVPIFIHRAKLLHDYAASVEMQASNQAEADFYEAEMEEEEVK